MHLKRNPTPVASNPRGLCSDRIAYRKYIHSVQEVDQRKTGNGYTKLCKTDSEKGIDNKNSYTSNVTSKATAKKLSSRGNVESPKPNQASSKIVSSITSKNCSNSTEKNNDNFKVEPREPVFDRTTRKQMEKERRKTVREQTVLNKPLKQWILVDSSSISSPRSDYLEPRLRLESLRAMSKKPASLNWWDKSNNVEDTDVPFNDSFPKEVFHPSDASNSLDNNNNETKGRIKSLWDKRIEEHDKWLDTELKRPKNLHKSWKPSDLLSASLLAVKDEQNSNPIIVYGSTSSREPSDPLFTQPINYLELANMKRYTGENFSVEPEPEFRVNPNFAGNVYDPYADQRETFTQSSLRNVSQTRNQWQQRVDDSQQPIGQKLSSAGINVNQVQPVIKNGRVEYEVQVEPRNYQTVERETYRNRGEVRPAASSEAQSRNYQTVERELPRNYQTVERDAVRNRGTSSPSVYYEQKLVVTPEREKQLLVTYLCTHPQVVSSVGITIPTHIKQKFTPSANTRVELLEVVQPIFYAEDNNPLQFNWQNSKNGPINISSNAAAKPVGRYEKNPNLSSATHGAAPKIAQKIIEQRNVVAATEQGFEPISSKKQWKLAEWVEPPPPVNKNDVLMQESNDFDKTVYKSPGESLIAREIRELKEREAELRSSRSELGLPQVEDLVQQREAYVDHRDNGPIPLRSAQSYDHLQIVVENGLQQYNSRNELQKVPIKSGSMDQLHYMVQSNEMNDKQYYVADDRQKQTGVNTSNIMYTRGAPKTLYGQFLHSHHPSSPERVRLVQSFDVQSQQIPAEPQPQQVRVSAPPPRKSEYTSIEARIEQEVQELKQREEELRRQREFLITNPSETNGTTETMVDSAGEYEDYGSARQRIN